MVEFPLAPLREPGENLEAVFLTQHPTKGYDIVHDVEIDVLDTRLEFKKCPFSLKSEVKAMQGSHWHGFDEKDKRKIWSVHNTPRNWFQIRYLMGMNPYEWFDQPLRNHTYREYMYRRGTKSEELRNLREHQVELADAGLTFRYQIWAAEMGVGKTLAAQAVMEAMPHLKWLWIGPKKSKENIICELESYEFPFDQIDFQFQWYEQSTKTIDEWKDNGWSGWFPQGIILDESSRLKGEESNRSRNMQALADKIRERYGWDGFVILMSGTPSPKAPTDWWRQCEIAFPGFLREGSKGQLEKRLRFMELYQDASGMSFNQPTGWKDDTAKCAECGELKEHRNHTPANYADADDLVMTSNRDTHDWRESINEVAFLRDRLDGLAIVKHKYDVLDLPDKIYEEDVCEPTESMLRAAKSLLVAAPNIITGLTWTREVSDGFMYKDEEKGTTKCTQCSDGAGTVIEWFHPDREDESFDQIDFFSEAFVKQLEQREVTCRRCGGTGQMKKFKRVAKNLKSPKEAKLKNRLAECEETGRIVVFAGFQGSVDRVTTVCHRQGWDVVRCDGRGWQVTRRDGTVVKTDKPLEYWKDWANQYVAFVAHPASGGLSLNLTESRMAVFYSNDYNPESRSQAEDRVHRMGMDVQKGCKIVDIYHLPIDRRVRDILVDNRRLELLTLGDLRNEIEEALT